MLQVEYLQQRYEVLAGLIWGWFFNTRFRGIITRFFAI